MLCLSIVQFVIIIFMLMLLPLKNVIILININSHKLGKFRYKFSNYFKIIFILYRISLVWFSNCFKILFLDYCSSDHFLDT